MSGDYDFLNDHDDFMAQQNQHFDKTFDHPVTNDPLSALESNIESNSHIYDPGPLESSSMSPLPDPIGPAPLVPDPAVHGGHDRFGYHAHDPHMRGHEGYNWSGERTFWREPPIPPLRPTAGKSYKKDPYIPKYRPQAIHSEKKNPKLSGKIECPAEDMALISRERCQDCSMFDLKISGVFDHCRGKQLVADQLAGKKVDEKVKTALEEAKK